MKKMEYYYDYTPEAYDYIMNSKILRNRDKNILKDLVDGKSTKQIAIDNNCSYRTLCTRRKEIFEKTKCLMSYNKSMGDIEEYYKTHCDLKIYDIDEFRVIHTDTDLYQIYLLTFPNDKVYIGVSKNADKRWKKGNGYTQNEDMYNDILKYGWVNIRKDIIYKDLYLNDALEKETELILQHKSYVNKYGYNKKVR